MPGSAQVTSSLQSAAAERHIERLLKKDVAADGAELTNLPIHDPGPYTVKKASFTKGEKPTFHTPLDNFVKLRLWQLEDYESVVFIDADAIVLKSCDKLFGYPEFCAAPNVYEALADFHRMNSGVFTARPSRATFARMMAELGG